MVSARRFNGDLPKWDVSSVAASVTSLTRVSMASVADRVSMASVADSSASVASASVASASVMSTWTWPAPARAWPAPA